jgi:4-hydroxybenzoate polyprenyltransferase
MSRSKLLALVASIRTREVLILQGAPLLGVAFSIGPITPARLLTAAIFAIASFLLLAHIFTLNDWADFARGVHHANGAISRLEREGITPTRLLCFSVVLVAVALLLFLFVSPRCFLVASAITLLGIFYSHTSIDSKGVPIVSSLLHFVGGMLHFLLGYALFSEMDGRALAVGSFFALTFAAGHLNQEIRDYDVDRATGARTNAVAFGKTATFFAGLMIFTLCYLDLFLLAWTRIVPRPLAVLPIVLLPIHVLLSMRTFREGLTSNHIQRFQTHYRFLYAVIGGAMLLGALVA